MAGRLQGKKIKKLPLQHSSPCCARGTVSRRIESSCRERKPIKLFQELFQKNCLLQLLPGPGPPQPDLVCGEGYRGVKRSAWGEQVGS